MDRPVWRSPDQLQGFVLCKADGTVLAELPPTMRIESTIGQPEPRQPPGPRQANRGGAASTVKRVLSTANTGASLGTKKKKVSETTNRTEDYYTWERAPFSDVWFALGDGLPSSKPKDDSGTTTIVTEEDGRRVTETTTKSRTQAGETTTVVTEVTTTVELLGASETETEVTVTEEDGERVTETVRRQAASVGGQPGTETTTTRETVPLDGAARYAVSEAYWGSEPASLLMTNDLGAAYGAAYAHNLETGSEVWVLERRGGGYDLLEKFEAPAPPQIVLSTQWFYRSGDEMLMHASEIEDALAQAAQLMFRGRTLATLDPQRPSRLETTTADRMRDVTYKLTFYTTEYLTAQEFRRRQLA